MEEPKRYVDLQGTMKALGGASMGPPAFSRARFQEMVDDPECIYHGEDVYIPYLWMIHCETNVGHAQLSDENGVQWRIDVRPQYVEHFPELAGVESVIIHESLEGLVTQL